MLGKSVKAKLWLIVLAIAVIGVAVGAYFTFSHNASAEIGEVSAMQVTDIVTAEGDGTNDASTEDAGEVQKDDIVDFHLQATYTGVGESKSGLVTFTDVLPEHMELVTGTQTVNGKQTNCNPAITNSSGVRFAEEYSYNTNTRTFTAKVTGIPAVESGDGNVVDIHIYAKVTDDATSLTEKLQKKVENVYYTNYVTVTHAAASSTSNKVQFHSGNISDETYTISYRFAGNTKPAGVEPPATSTAYGKGSEVTIEPAMQAQGYNFSGWSLVTDGLTEGSYVWDSANQKFTLNAGTTSVTNVIFEGTWTQARQIDVKYEWKGKATDNISGDTDSPSDAPNIDVPATTKSYEKMPIKIPSYPATDEERADTSSYDSAEDAYQETYKQYKFLGWRVMLGFADGGTSELILTTTDKKTKEFTPTFASNKTLSSVTLRGYWTKRTYKVTINHDSGINNWSDAGLATPSEATYKWGETFNLPIYKPTGYKFNGWKTEPDLGAGSDTQDGNNKQFTMPANDVVATASFTQMYKVNITSGTASTSNASEGASIDAFPGEVVTVKPIQNLVDVRFKEWTSSVATEANNWVLNDDGTASFTMPNQTVNIVGNYEMEIDFLVVNGKWSADGESGFKSEMVAMTRQADNTWIGTLSADKVPTGMVADVSHKQDSGKWFDDNTNPDPSTITGSNNVKADASGEATHSLLFTYTFTDALDNITITYKANNPSYGTVKLADDTGEGSAQVEEANINPIGDDNQVKGAVATANKGYAFKGWLKDSDTEHFSIGATFKPFKVYNTGATAGFFEQATYTADFEPNSYIVRFHSNGGTGGTMDEQSIKVGTSTALATNKFTRTGYNFAGWTTNADGSGDFYSDGQEVLDLMHNDGEYYDLYAKWSENKGTATDTAKPDGSESGKITGYANNIRISLEQAIELAGKTDATSLNTLTSLSGAFFSYITTDKDPEILQPTTVHENHIEGAVGKYQVMLGCNKSGFNNSAYVTFDVNVFDQVSGDDVNNPTIRIAASDFIVSADEVKNGKLNDGTSQEAQAELKKLARAYAWNVATNDEVSITTYRSTIAVDGDGKGIKGTYDVTFGATLTDKTAEVTVKATVTDKTDEAATYRVSAHDFAVKKGATLNDSDIIGLASAKGISTSTGAESRLIVDTGTLDTSKVGKYNITFRIHDIGAPKVTVVATVFDNMAEQDGEVISADNFTIKKDDVNDSLTDSKLIQLANATAYEKGTSKPLTVSVKDKGGLTNVKGSYTITFKTDKGTETTAIATVTDKSSTAGEDGDENALRLDANDFSVSLADVKLKNLTSDTQGLNELKKLAKAKATKISDGSDVDSITATSHILEAKGSYTVTFSATLGNNTAIVDVIATVTDNSGSEVVKPDPSKPDQTDTVTIYANDFTVSKADVEKEILKNGVADKDALIRYAKASASRASDGSAVAITEANTAIKAVKGIYDVEFKTEVIGDKQVSIKIKANVTDNSSTGGEVIDPDLPDPKPDPTDPDAPKVYISIYANDFTVSKTEVENGLTKDKLVGLANARAEYSKDGSNVTIASVDSSAVQAKKGTYSVLFTSEKKGDVPAASITVNATVTDKSEEGGEVVDPDPDPSNPDAKVHISIYANDFTIKKDDVASLNVNKLIEFAGARAEYSKDGSSVAIASVDYSKIEAKRGTYTVKFTSAAKDKVSAATIDVNATVTDSSGENSGTTEDGKKDGVRAFANNFTVSVQEVKDNNLGDASAQGVLAKLKTYANARAERILDGSEVEIVEGDSSIEAEKGEYNVSFKTAQVGNYQATVSVVATVVDNADRGDVPDPEKPNKSDKINIYANNFSMSVDDVTPLLNGDALTTEGAKKLIALADARAENISDKSEVEIATVVTAIKAVKGTYDVEFRSAPQAGGKYASVTVKATVTDKAEEADTVNIYANDFSVSAQEVKDEQLNNGDTGLAHLVKRAGAVAEDKAGNSVAIEKAVSHIQPKSGSYNVIFTSAVVNDKSAEITVKATVKDNVEEDADKGERITANNFVLSMEEATGLKNGTISTSDAKEILIKRAKAEATDLNDGSGVAIDSVNYTSIEAKAGRYAVIFATAKGTSVTVYATVSEDVKVDGQVAINATGFTVSVAEVESMKLDDADASKDELIALAQAKAWDTVTHEPLEISNVTSEIKAVRGDYSVSFSATNGNDTNTISVDASVKDRKVEPSNPDPDPNPDPEKPTPGPVDPDNDIVLYANNFAVSVADVQKFSLTDGDASLDKLVELADAEARKRSDNSVVDIVKATSKIEAAKGNYTVEFETDTVNDKKVTMEVEVTVYDSAVVVPDPSTPDDPTSGIVLYGNNFTLSQAEAQAIANGTVYSGSANAQAFATPANDLNEGQKELIRLAGVVAYNGKDAAEVDITGVDFLYTGTPGDYTVTFHAQSGNVTGSLNVTGTVTNESSENVQNQERISANNISYTLDEAKDLLAKSNDEIASQLAKDSSVYAISTLDGSAVDVVEATWNIEAKAGTYDVTFATAKGTSVTIKAAVAGEGENPLSPEELAKLSASKISNTGDNIGVYVTVALLIVLISTGAVIISRRKRAQH